MHILFRIVAIGIPEIVYNIQTLYSNWIKKSELAIDVKVPQCMCQEHEPVCSSAIRFVVNSG